MTDTQTTTVDECQVLTEVLEIFGPNGEHWGKLANFSSHSDRYCLAGAIRKAMFGNPFGGYDERYLDQLPHFVLVLTREVGHQANATSVTYWNDKYGTKWDHVKALVTRAQQAACGEQEGTE